jgi:hypothetical protein
MRNLQMGSAFFTIQRAPRTDKGPGGLGELLARARQCLLPRLRITLSELLPKLLDCWVILSIRFGGDSLIRVWQMQWVTWRAFC